MSGFKQKLIDIFETFYRRNISLMYV